MSLGVVASGVAAAVAAAFSAALARRYVARGGVNRALVTWSVALAMFAVAALALAVGEAAGWSSGWFRLYYLLGAVLVVPWLALGTVQISASDPVTVRVLGATALAAAALLAVPAVTADEPARFVPGVVLALLWALLLLPGRGEAAVAGSMVLVATFTAVATVAVLAGELQAAVPTDRLPEGRDLYAPAIRGLAIGGNAVGALLVIVGAATAAVRLRGKGAPQLVVGNLLIALGVLVAASGGTFAFLGDTEGHAVAFALGVALMYAGFTRTTRPVGDRTWR